MGTPVVAGPVGPVVAGPVVVVVGVASGVAGPVVAGPVAAGPAVALLGDPNFGVDGSDVTGVGGPVVSGPVVARSASARTASSVICRYRCAAALAVGTGGGSLRFMTAIAGNLWNSLS